MAKVEIQIEHNVEHKTSYKFSDLVYFYITSQENSPGGSFYDFKDGKPLQVTMDKNNIVGYNIQPQMTKYLRETGECLETVPPCPGPCPYDDSIRVVKLIAAL